MKILFADDRWQIDDVDVDLAKKVLSVPFEMDDPPNIDDPNLDMEFVLNRPTPVYFTDKEAAEIALVELTNETTRLEELHGKVLAHASEALKPVASALTLLDGEDDWDSNRLRSNLDSAHLHLDDIWGS